MKPTIIWLLAGSASVLTGCGDREYTMDLERLEQSAGIVSDITVPAETPLPAGAVTAGTETATQETAAVDSVQGRNIYTGK